MSHPRADRQEPSPLEPTRVRYGVVGFAVALAVIQYVDRVCISQAAPLVSEDLGLSPRQMGYVFSAFTLAYALFEIPAGALGDRVGPRKVLLRIVLWWSFFTAATGWAWSWLSLVATRFLFGAGEAGCFPNLAKALHRWLPSHERTRAQGLLWMSARWGGAATPLLVYLCLQHVHWRTAFLLFGLLGVAWAAAFFLWYRDDPRAHPSVNAAEAALVPASPPPPAGHLGVPWGRWLRSRTVWCLCGQYAALSYVWYFFITWFPTYLLKARGFDIRQSAWLAGTPLLLGGFGSLAAGWLSPWLGGKLGGMRKVRCGLGATGYTVGASLLVASTLLANPYAAVAAIALVSFFNDLALPGSWATCMDVGGRYVATLGGAMNMMGNFGGFLSPIVTGYVLERTGSWTGSFYVAAAVYVVGAACWLALDPVTPLEQQTAGARA
jgi:MFS transporter, ACS family, glucarate transporter